MKIEELMQQDDWRHAMDYGPPPAAVAEVLATSEGEPDGESWLAVFRMQDGTFGLLAAGVKKLHLSLTDEQHLVLNRQVNDMVLRVLGESYCLRSAVERAVAQEVQVRAESVLREPEVAEKVRLALEGCLDPAIRSAVNRATEAAIGKVVFRINEELRKIK